MGKIRKDLIRIKLKEIQENLRLVEDNLPETYLCFSGLGLVKDGLYKKTEFCIENVLDICSILNSDLGLGIPEDEEDILNKLIEAKILTKELGAKVKGMKGFRNFLVHRYGRIDDRKAYSSIKKGLKDFAEFEKEIKTFLRKN